MGAVTASSVLLVAIFQANFDGAINQPPFASAHCAGQDQQRRHVPRVLQ